MRRILPAIGALAAACLLPNGARAQSPLPSTHKALVYCPAIDTVGCSNIVAALGSQYSQVDRAYDGTSGTVDLKTVELGQYEVFFVPSLADGGDAKPYDFLRDATIAARLHEALVGRVALWSGTPDLGTATSANRDQKNALILNLAAWASATYAKVKGPGLVTFLDQSEPAANRYNWVQATARVKVTADSAVQSYASVSALTATAQQILTSGGTPLAYDNMASFGFQVPDGAAGVSLDALGETGGSVDGQAVLLTGPGGDTGGTGTLAFFVHAHQDDWQLFMGDRASAAVQTAAGMVFVYLTAGNGEPTDAYWESREAGSLAAADALPIGGSGSWSCAPQAINGHNIRRCVKGKAIHYFLRLPDGGNDEPQSLSPLRDQPAGSLVLSAIDNSTSYKSWADLTATFDGIVDFEASAHGTATNVEVHAPEYNRPTQPWDHPDHYATADLVHAASAGHNWTYWLYVDYFGEYLPANLSDAARNLKLSEYGAYDRVMTGNNFDSHLSIPQYQAWLGRTYYRASTATPVAQPPIPATALSLQPISESQIDLQWSDNSNFENGYRIERAPDVAGAPGTFAPVFSTGPEETKHSDNELSASTTYWYRVMAFNNAGDASAYSNQVSATTLGPACLLPTVSVTPTSLTANLGDPASFTAAATGTAPFTYQWRKGTLDAPVIINGATLQAYSIGSVSPADAGAYSVVASNGCGSATSAIATLGVSKRTPVFSGLTPPLSIAYGTQSVAVGGAISLNGQYPTGSISVTLGGATTTASINSSSGAFAATLVTSSLGASTAPYLVTYSYSGDAGFFGASDIRSTTVTVGKVSQSIAFTSTAPANAVYGGTYTPTASGSSSGNSIVFGTTTPAVCALSGADVHFVGTGSCTVTADQQGNANYDPAEQRQQTFSVGKRAVQVTANAQTKTYGATDPALTYQVTNGQLVAGDAFTGALTRAPGEAVAGSPYAIAQGTLTAGSNYDLTFVTSALQITKKSLTIDKIVAANKTYDGNTRATLTGATLAGIVGEDLVGVSTSGSTAAFTDKQAGTNKIVTATGLVLDGRDAGNYSLGSTTATTTASITPRALTISAAGVNKVYDASTSASVTLSDDRLAGDNLTDAFTSASFGDKSVGTGKTVTVSGITVGGTDAPNYTFNSGTTTTASVSVRTLAVTAVAAAKVYDGTTAASVKLSDDRIAGDVLTTAYESATFADANAGIQKIVTVGGITLTGADAGNYKFNTSATATADIAKAGQQLTFTAPTSGTYGDAPFTVSAISNAGLPVSLAANGPCSVSGSSVTITGAGNCALTATQPGNANYNPASPATQTVQLRNPVPALATAQAVQPATIKAGDPTATMLTVTGSGFAPGSVVRISGTDLATTFVSGAQLTAAIPASATATPTTLYVTVFNGGPGGGTSIQSAVFVLDNSVTLSASTTQTNTDPNGITRASIAGLSATANGAGTIALAQFANDPAAPITGMESSSRFFDVAVSAGSSFTSLTASFCDTNGGGQVVWWTGSAWQAVTPSGAIDQSTGCITINLDAASNPTLSSITRTPFAITKRPQTITFPALPNKSYGDAPFSVTATANSGLPVSFSVGATDQCTITGNVVKLTAAGSCTVTASQPGGTGYSAAQPVSQGFSVGKATATVTLGGLSQAYDGTVKRATVSTDPSGLSTSITYNGTSTTPTNAGSYTVVATVSDPNYQGTATGTLTIAPAPLSIVWIPTATTLSDQTTAPAKLTASQLNASVVKPNGTTISTTLSYAFASTGAAAVVGSAMPVGLGTGITASYTSTDPNYASPEPLTKNFDVLNVVDFLINNPFNIVQLSDTKTTEYTAAFITTSDFDASTIDPATVLLGDGIDSPTAPDAKVERNADGTLKFSIVDVNVDGKKDLLLYFTRQSVNSSGLTTAMTQIVLRGQTKSGRAVRGTDKVSVSP